MHFHRRLDVYLMQNHGYGRSGRLTPAQRRRLWKKNRTEMIGRKAAYLGVARLKEWA